MSRRGLLEFHGVRGPVAVATIVAMALVAVPPAVALDMATFAGTVYAPDNSAARGFSVAFRDVTSGREFRSEQTGAAGDYQVSVPVGGRYKLESVIAPDGAALPIQNSSPIPVRKAGANRLDVTFADAAGGGNAAPPSQPSSNHGGAVWWKQPGPIIGLVLGTLGVVGLAVGLGNNHPPASPSTTGGD